MQHNVSTKIVTKSTNVSQKFTKLRLVCLRWKIIKSDHFLLKDWPLLGELKISRLGELKFIWRIMISISGQCILLCSKEDTYRFFICMQLQPHFCKIKKSRNIKKFQRQHLMLNSWKSQVTLRVSWKKALLIKKACISGHPSINISNGYLQCHLQSRPFKFNF